MRRPDDADIRRAQGVARAVAGRMLRGRAVEGIDVDDVVQDVLIRFAEQDLDSIRNPDAWVTTAARNRCTDVLDAQRRHRLETLEEPELKPEGRQRARQLAHAVLGPSAGVIAPMVLLHAVAELSEREQAILVKHGLGWDNAALADEFGFAGPRSAAVALSRIKAKVRARFESASQRRELLGAQRVY